MKRAFPILFVTAVLGLSFCVFHLLFSKPANDGVRTGPRVAERSSLASPGSPRPGRDWKTGPHTPLSVRDSGASAKDDLLPGALPRNERVSGSPTPEERPAPIEPESKEGRATGKREERRPATKGAKAPERNDLRPEDLAGYWAQPPMGWVDDQGLEHDPLEKIDNPEIELGKFWLDEKNRDLFRHTENGSFRVKRDRAVVEEEGRTATLRGRVVDRQTGAGLPDASVVLFSTFYKRQIFYDHHLQEVAGALTRPDGSFTLAGFNTDDVHFGSAGKAFLTIIRHGYVSCVGWYLGALVPGIENLTGDVPLDPGCNTVRGLVLDLSGSPVHRAVVAFTGEIFPTEYSKDQRYAFLPHFPHARTGADGRFEMEGIRGFHWVSVHVGTDCVASRLIEFEKEDPDPLRFVVLAGGLVDGRVVDGEDRPVADAVVYGGNNSTHSYADGRFRLENISGKVITLVIHHHLFRPVTVENVLVGETERRVVLKERKPRVRFRVLRKEDRSPVTRVRIWFGPPDTVVRPLPESDVYTSEEGLYEVAVPGGSGYASVSAEQRESCIVSLMGVGDSSPDEEGEHEEVEVLLGPQSE